MEDEGRLRLKVAGRLTGFHPDEDERTANRARTRSSSTGGEEVKNGSCPVAQAPSAMAGAGCVCSKVSAASMVLQLSST